MIYRRKHLLARIARLERQLAETRERLALLDSAPPPGPSGGKPVPVVHEPSGRRYRSAREAADDCGCERSTIVHRCASAQGGWRRGRAGE
jgi:hypothetical protein